MAKVRVGVIGAGSWAVAAHLPALTARPEVNVVGISRLGDTALRRVGERFDVPFVTEDYRELLDRDLDAVVVASPSSEHYDHARAALTAGCHVLCEKPFTVRPADAWGLVQHADEVGRQLMVSFGWNYSPLVREVSRVMRKSGIGETEHFDLTMSSYTRELLSGQGSYPDADPDTVPESRTWTDISLSGGGYGHAQLSHALALLFRFVDESVVKASAVMSGGTREGVELHVASTLVLERGAIGTMSGSSIHAGSHGNKHGLTLNMVGSEGHLHLDLERERAMIFRPDGNGTDVRPALGSGTYQGALPANAFIDVVLERRPNNDANGRLGARTVDALDLIYAAAR